MPDWFEPVARYILEDGLPGTLYVSSIAVVGSALIGILLVTLLTIEFMPLKAAIRLYIEVWRGLQILVTVPPVPRTIFTNPGRFGLRTIGSGFAAPSMNCL